MCHRCGWALAGRVWLHLLQVRSRLTPLISLLWLSVFILMRKLDFNKAYRDTAVGKRRDELAI